MKRNNRKHLFTFLTLFSLFLLLVVPASLAQESTAEPAPEVTATEAPTEVPTEAPTEAPTEEATEPPVETPTEEPVVTDEPDEPSATPEPEITEEAQPTETPVEPAPEVTAEPEAPTDEPAPEVTAEPEATATEAPTEETTQAPVELDSLFEDFQNWTGDGWLLSGWDVVTDENGNAYLTSSSPNATATVLNMNWADVLLTAKVRVAADNVANLSVRVSTENYRVMLDIDGNSRLYRGDTLLSASPIPEDDGAEEAESPTKRNGMISVYRSLAIALSLR